MGRVERIWIKRARRNAMDEATDVRVRAGKGIVGNADQGGWRQVTIVSAERWAALMQELGLTLDPSARRANLLVSGIELSQTRDRVLSVGATRLRVKGETRPCKRMEAAATGLRDAMRQDWNGGVFAEVLVDGSIAVGDPVQWEVEAEAETSCESSRS